MGGLLLDGHRLCVFYGSVVVLRTVVGYLLVTIIVGEYTCRESVKYFSAVDILWCLGRSSGHSIHNKSGKTSGHLVSDLYRHTLLPCPTPGTSDYINSLYNFPPKSTLVHDFTRHDIYRVTLHAFRPPTLGRSTESVEGVPHPSPLTLTQNPLLNILVDS